MPLTIPRKARVFLLAALLASTQGYSSHDKGEDQSAHQSYLNFSEIPDDLAPLTQKAHMIVITDQELANNFLKAKLSILLDTNPNHKVVLSLGNSKFVQNGVLSLSKDDIPQNLRHLSLVNPEGNITTIANKFLYKCKSLISFDAQGLTNLTTIESFFLNDCESLITFNTQGLHNVKTIGIYFLSGCLMLQDFDAQGFSNLITIKRCFLLGCKSLVSLDTRGFNNVETIEEDFLSECINLTSIDTRGLTHLITIGDDFLFRCEKLPSFDTEFLASLKTIGKYFLFKCPSLNNEGKEKIKEYLYRRGIEWKSDDV